MHPSLLALIAVVPLAQAIPQKQTPPAATVASAGAQLKRCNTKLSEDTFVEAETCFRAALRQQPNNAALRHGLGRALWKEGKTDDAEAELRTAVKLAPANPDYPASLIDFFVAQMATDRVIELAPGWIQKFPKMPNFLAAYGRALVQRHQIEEARQQYRNAARLSGKYSALYYWMFVETLIAAGETEEAIRAIREKAAFEPLTDADRTALAKLLVKQKRWDEAVAEYRLTSLWEIRAEVLADHLAAEGDIEAAVGLYKAIVKSSTAMGTLVAEMSNSFALARLL